ncbi:MAG: 50S ribosomal protein L1 [Alphaproteobacteria bacterium]|jgi:large subunit ribosomal protein L1
MAKKGKRLTAAYKSVDALKAYELDEAIATLKSAPKAKFDETVEIVMGLNVDPRQADQMIRGVVALPNGTGKTARVAVFAKGPKLEEAIKAGADVYGAEDLMETILSGKIEFDRCIATPDMMGVVGRLGKILGPRGLMPNPKLGTVTNDVAGAIKAVKAGQVEFRVESAGQIHAGVGKISFSEEQIKQNIVAFAQAILKAKPASVKGTYLKRVALSTTQGAGVKVAVSSIASAAAGN